MSGYLGTCRRALDIPGSTVVKNLPANAGDMGSIPGSEDPLEKEMANHSGILAIPFLEGYSPQGRKEAESTEQPYAYTEEL